ncbi:hypothetical protein SRHO_G00024340 [Serrasalmus rhombeus]
MRSDRSGAAVEMESKKLDSISARVDASSSSSVEVVMFVLLPFPSVPERECGPSLWRLSHELIFCDTRSAVKSRRGVVAFSYRLIIFLCSVHLT